MCLVANRVERANVVASRVLTFRSLVGDLHTKLLAGECLSSEVFVSRKTDGGRQFLEVAIRTILISRAESDLPRSQDGVPDSQLLAFVTNYSLIRDLNHDLQVVTSASFVRLDLDLVNLGVVGSISDDGKT